MKIQTTKVYTEIDSAFKAGYTKISEQGSSRSSKTYNTLIWLIVHLLTWKKTRAAIVRKSMPTIKGSVYHDFEEIMKDCFGIWSDKCMNRSEMVYRFPNGSELEFFGCDNEQKMRGRKRDVLYCNEANELSYMEFNQLIMRTTRLTIIDYNPSYSDDHWICSFNREPKTYHFITTYKDNPFLEQTIIDQIESLKDKNETLWRVYGLGLQGMVEGLVFKDVQIVESVPPPALKWRRRGMDFGYTNDPTAIVDVYMFGKDVYIDEVCYRTNMLTNDIIDELKPERQLKTISESADPRLVQEIYRAGINIHPVVKFKGSVEAGITKMQEYSIHVTARSVNVIKEFRNYTYAQDKEGKWLNQPIDAFNHCFLAATPVLTDGGSKPIASIRVGDCVATSVGMRRVTKTFDNGRQIVRDYTLTFDGVTINLTATPDHYIKTTEGWVKLKDLKAGQMLFLSRTLTERSITSTTEKGISQEGRTDCTATCGSTTTGSQCQKDTKSTILMGIRPTTPLTISLASALRSIRRCMQRKPAKELQATNRRRCLNESDRSQRRGMLPTKDANGTSSMRTISTTESRRRILAIVAGRRLWRGKMGSSAFAPTDANPSGDVTPSLTTRPECASGAAAHSVSTNTPELNFVAERVLEHIASSNERIEHVYDLEVEGIHEFIANGVVVHNCIDAIRYVFIMEILGGSPRKVDIAGIARAAF